MKHKSSLLFVLPLFLLFSCGESIPTSAEATTATETTSESTTVEPEPVITKTLTIAAYPSLDLFVYDALDLTGLLVNENIYTDGVLTSSDPIDDYELRWAEDKSLVASDYRFFSEGTYTILIEKEGATGTNFSFEVTESTALIQTLVINSLPKTTYHVGDTLSLDGLSVSLSTRYKADKFKRFTQVITDYTLTIDGEEVDGYVFEDMCPKQIEISYQGWEKDLSTSFTVSAVGDSHLTSLDHYEDSTIDWRKDSTKMTVRISNPNKPNEEGDKGYFAPDEIVNEFNLKQYSKSNAYNWHYTPSKGKVPFLIVPVIIPGYESWATNENWNLIYKAFFGNSSSLKFESLRSYYYQSSFGQLDITGGVTGYFNPGEVDSTYKKASGFTDYTTAQLADLACKWAASSYSVNLNDYDTDDDGCIDGMWMVYLHPSSGSSNFWGYTSTTSEVGTVEAPKVNTFGWASLDFLNDDFRGNGKYFSNHECDAHVLIHETGHMLGLSDYYSYGENGYGPTGNMDMMDHNINDHNSYSKMLYGWINPYIVYGNATITLDSIQSQDSVILIPYDSAEYLKNEEGKVRFTPFDEYLVLDYFTPLNLNAQGYDCYSMNPLTASGGRLEHVDARLFNYSYSGLTEIKANDLLNSDGSYSYFRPITNTESGNRAESVYHLENANTFDELRWITANKVLASANNPVTNASLFTASSSFSFEAFKNQFNTTKKNNKNYYFNNQEPTSANFEIISIS